MVPQRHTTQLGLAIAIHSEMRRWTRQGLVEEASQWLDLVQREFQR